MKRQHGTLTAITSSHSPSRIVPIGVSWYGTPLLSITSRMRATWALRLSPCPVGDVANSSSTIVASYAGVMVSAGRQANEPR